MQKLAFVFLAVVAARALEINGGVRGDVRGGAELGRLDVRGGVRGGAEHGRQDAWGEHSDRQVYVSKIWNVHYIGGDPSDANKPVVAHPLKMTVIDVKEKEEALIAKLEEKKEEAKKDVVKLDKDIKEGFNLLDKAQDLKANDLTAAQAVKAGKLEEKIFDALKKDVIKINEAKADEKVAKLAETLAKAVGDIKAIETVQDKKAATSEERATAAFDAKLRDNRAIGLAQQALAPKIIQELQNQIRTLDGDADVKKANKVFVGDAAKR